MDVYEARLQEPVVDTRAWKPGHVAGVDFRARLILVKYENGRRWCKEKDVEKVNVLEG